MPTAANLNLYRGGNSRVNWHSDNEPLFGRSGVHKLIVSVSFGPPVLFKWRGKSCLDSGERSCWLGHGEETTEHMPLFPNTWFDGRKVQDPISIIETGGAGVFGKFFWEQYGIVGLEVMWIS